MNVKEDQKSKLIHLLKQNELESLTDVLIDNQMLDVHKLKTHLKANEIEALCEELKFTTLQKIHFRTLLSLIPSQTDNIKKSLQTNVNISDEIHDYIPVPQDIKVIIDTPEFQRLRELKQLGATYFVFPGASHNRFEHSLGVYHLARKLILFLQHNQAELQITDQEIYCVSAAGLLHDLGHGPFSHVFDHQFVPSVSSSNIFRHESMSIKLINKLFHDNQIEIHQDALNLICALVSPSTHPTIVAHYKSIHRAFLFEIIANDINGIDVDKWDYFMRDSHNLSLDISFKYTRLLAHCRVIDDHICFHDKTNYAVQILFNTRYDLFKRVYSHKTSKSVEYMICDILRLANERFKITQKIQNAGDFMELTDNIISRIQWADCKEDKELQKAQRLIHRIHTRDLYKCVKYVLLESLTVQQHEKALRKELKNEDEDDDVCLSDDNKAKEKESSKIDYHFVEREWRKAIFQILKRQNKGIEEEMECDGSDAIICQLMSISYGSEKRHPLQDVFFYNSKQPNVAKLIDMDQITTLHDPDRFREIIFRVYVKEKKWTKQAEKAVNTFCGLKKLINPNQLCRHTSLGLSPKTTKISPRTNKDAKKPSKTKRKLAQVFDKMSVPTSTLKKQKLDMD